MPVIIVSNEQKPYIESMQQFLDMIASEKIKCIACVALVDDEELHNITSYWNITAYEKMTCANVINTNAVFDVIKQRFIDMGFDLPE